MIRLRFSRGVGLAGAVVRAATWSPFSHVGFIGEAGTVLDATPEHGVAIREPSASDHEVICDVVLPDHVLHRAITFARRQIGKPYDWRAIAGFALRRDWHDERAWFCSELVAAAFEAAGYPLLRAEHLDRITPRDLYLSPFLLPLPAPAGGGRGAVVC